VGKEISLKINLVITKIMEEIKKYKLSSSSELIKSAWGLCKKHWRNLLPISLFISLLTYLLSLIDFHFLKGIDPTTAYLTQTVLWILSGLLMTLGTISIIHILNDKKGTVQEILRKVLPLVTPLFAMGLVANFITGGGAMPLIIPGIVLMISFMFLPFVYLLEKREWLNALLRSSNLTKNFRWSLLWKYIVLLLWIFFLIIPIFLISNILVVLTKTIELNGIASILSTTLMFPLCLSFSFVVYNELNKAKPKDKFVPSEKGKNIYTFLLVWGIIIFLSVTAARFAFPDKQIFNENHFVKQFDLEAQKLEKVFGDDLFEDDFSVQIDIDQKVEGDTQIKIDYKNLSE
jgi:hypothetical protein